MAGVRVDIIRPRLIVGDCHRRVAPVAMTWEVGGKDRRGRRSLRIYKQSPGGFTAGALLFGKGNELLQMQNAKCL